MEENLKDGMELSSELRRDGLTGLTALALALAAYGARKQWLVYGRNVAKENGMDEAQVIKDIEALPPGWWMWVVESMRKYVCDELKVKSNEGEAMVLKCHMMCDDWLTDKEERLKMEIAYSFSEEYEAQQRIDEKKKDGEEE